MQSQLINNWNDLYKGEHVPQWEDLEPNVQFCNYILSRASTGMRILELGAGLGYNAMHLAQKGLDIVASDISTNAVNRCRELADSTRTKMGCMPIDILSLNGDEGKFDLIYEKGCWHTFFDDEARKRFALAVSSLLVDGGLWITSSGSADSKDDLTDPNLHTYPRLTLRNIANAVEEYFEIDEVKKGRYGDSDGRCFVTWECVFQKRTMANKAIYADAVGAGDL